MIILGSNLAADKDGLAVLDAFAFTRLRSVASASRKALGWW